MRDIERGTGLEPTPQAVKEREQSFMDKLKGRSKEMATMFMLGTALAGVGSFEKQAEAQEVEPDQIEMVDPSVGVDGMKYLEGLFESGAEYVEQEEPFAIEIDPEAQKLMKKNGMYIKGNTFTAEDPELAEKISADMGGKFSGGSLESPTFTAGVRFAVHPEDSEKIYIIVEDNQGGKQTVTISTDGMEEFKYISPE